MGFVSLGESWCDTTTDGGRLMLTIMGGIAEFELGLIRRTDEGIERAKKQGKIRPVPSVLMPVRSGSLRTVRRLARQSRNSLMSMRSALAPFGVHFNPSKPQRPKRRQAPTWG